MRATLTLDQRHTALLLIDLQEEQRQVPHYAVAGFDAVLANAGLLLAAARAHGVLVVHAAYRRDYEACPPRPLEPRQADGSAFFSAKDSPLIAICAEAAPRDGEPVLFKNDASAFCESELGPLLSAAGVVWLIVAGVWTEACVAATVRDAIALGLRVLLVKDACGSGTLAMHQTGILNLANRLSGGAVADTAATCRMIAGEEAGVWMAERPVPLLFTLETAAELYESL
jgi:nicotinamidase-related amidase